MQNTKLLLLLLVLQVHFHLLIFYSRLSCCVNKGEEEEVVGIMK
jgi:hypothetical protein